MLNNYKENGYALVQSLVLLVVSSIVIGAMIALSRYSMAEYEVDSDYDSALLLAISGLEKTKYNISNAFRNYLYDLPDSGAAYKINWFDDLDKYTGSGVDPKYHVETPTEGTFEHTLDEAVVQNDDKKSTWRTNGTYTVTLSSVMPKDPQKNRKDPSVRYVKVQVKATVGNTTRTIEEVIKYGIESVIAQYAYFQNQPMFVKPTAMMRFNGDLRSNGNMSFVNNDGKIAGDVYASVCPDFGALGIGDISGTVSAVPLNEYNTNKNTDKQARPIYDEGYLYGYKPLDTAGGGAPKVREFENEPQINVPPLGNLDDYKEDGAWIKQAGKTLVDEVHSSKDVGVDGIAGSPDDGSIYLEGTRDNPIEIDGSVVIEGDVIIKGYITGHGSIYASKNIHVIGEVKYLNPPEWNKPTSKVDNQLDKDLVGFMAKGNVVFGNSEGINSKDSLLKASYPHDAPSSDASNGFDSDYNVSNGVEFNGDYSKYATAYNEQTGKVETLKRTDALPRDEMGLNNPFFIAYKKEVTTKITKKWIPPKIKRVKKSKQVPIKDSGSIGSSGASGETQYKTVYYWVKEVVKPGYWKHYDEPIEVISTPKGNAPPTSDDKIVWEDRRWISTRPRNLDWGNSIRPGDKIIINGAEYKIVAGNSGGIKLNRKLEGEKFNTKIESVILPYREYTVKDKRYYEPTVRSDFIKKHAEGNPSHFDGVYFTNHLVAGFLKDIKINGSIITRDSAFKISNSAEFNWDMRLAVSHGTSNMATIIGLPKNHSNVSVYWREL